jgi:hypothetical protein
VALIVVKFRIEEVGHLPFSCSEEFIGFLERRGQVHELSVVGDSAKPWNIGYSSVN